VGGGEEVTDTATFRATLPPILSAIRMAGDGGMRVMFDVPESDLGEATKLLMWRQQVLRVTIGPESDAGQDRTRKIHI
jgi:hypothetical protein